MRSDARANREALMDAALRLYAEQGPATRFTAIAQEAGVGPATLYRHFPTEDDLVAGLAALVRERVVAVCLRHQERVELDPVEAWTTFVRELVGLRLGAVLPWLVERVAQPSVAARVAPERTGAVEAVELVMTGAQRAGLVRTDVTIEQFRIGLAKVTRPLPRSIAAEDDPEHWLVDVYIRGLRPD